MTPAALARKWCPYHIEPNIALWPCHCVATTAAVRGALEEAEKMARTVADDALLEAGRLFKTPGEKIAQVERWAAQRIAEKIAALRGTP